MNRSVLLTLALALSPTVVMATTISDIRADAHCGSQLIATGLECSICEPPYTCATGLECDTGLAVKRCKNVGEDWPTLPPPPPPTFPTPAPPTPVPPVGQGPTAQPTPEPPTPAPPVPCVNAPQADVCMLDANSQILAPVLQVCTNQNTFLNVSSSGCDECCEAYKTDVGCREAEQQLYCTKWCLPCGTQLNTLPCPDVCENLQAKCPTVSQKCATWRAGEVQCAATNAECAAGLSTNPTYFSAQDQMAVDDSGLSPLILALIIGGVVVLCCIIAACLYVNRSDDPVEVRTTQEQYLPAPHQSAPMQMDPSMMQPMTQMPPAQDVGGTYDASAMFTQESFGGGPAYGAPPATETYQQFPQQGGNYQAPPSVTEASAGAIPNQYGAPPTVDQYQSTGGSPPKGGSDQYGAPPTVDQYQSTGGATNSAYGAAPNVDNYQKAP